MWSNFVVVTDLLFPRFVCLGARFKTTKAGVYFRNFSTDKKNNFSETRESEKILEEREKITFIRKDVMSNVSARKIILCEFFFCILNAIMILILRENDFWRGKFLWKDTQKESFLFWLRNWRYLITSSSSSALLLDILIFHIDVSQCLSRFLIGCI